MRSIDRALQDVRAERSRQDSKWGAANIVNRSPEFGLVVLGEEYGEACQAVLEMRAASQRPPSPLKTAQCEQWRDALRAELVQVAAVAVAMLEAVDALGRDK